MTYIEDKYMDKVAEFHKYFKAKISKNINIQDLDINKLRISLIQEELDEMKNALIEGDVVEVFDALCDLQYVLSGSILSLGFGDIFAEGFARVHDSNMSKICNTIDEAIQTKTHYESKGYICNIHPQDDKYIVLRDDGKILKSINYKEVNLKSLIK